MSKVKKHKCIRCVLKLLLIIVIVFAVISAFFAGYYFARRNHGNVLIEKSVTFSESADALNNPNRGFYYICGFRITDDNFVDYEELVAEKMLRSQQHSLSMVQINLREYKDGLISEKGLKDIATIFDALSKQNKQYLIRFLYDWNGENLQVEPQDVNVIVKHMEQLEGILHTYKDIIFVHQGIFIGNWGEMNGTIHLEHMQLLAETLRSSLHEDTYMAVRMPAQWRKITEIASPDKSDWEAESIAHNLSLFNDGMMGNYGDYGTYGTKSRSEVGDFTHWNREEELQFQEQLCKYVPNGGEVIIDNEYNDFENALDNLKTMHITYLNCDYDKSVLDKWAEETINNGTIYDGMDGLTYIDRHLGYRILLDSVSYEYAYIKDALAVTLKFKNVGFAPIYKEVRMNIHIINEMNGTVCTYDVEGELSELAGGNEAENVLEICKDIILTGYDPGNYRLYFSVTDVDSAMPIILANEQKMQSYGYELGEIVIEEMKLPFVD